MKHCYCLFPCWQCWTVTVTAAKTKEQDAKASGFNEVNWWGQLELSRRHENNIVLQYAGDGQLQHNSSFEANNWFGFSLARRYAICITRFGTALGCQASFQKAVRYAQMKHPIRPHYTGHDFCSHKVVHGSNNIFPHRIGTNLARQPDHFESLILNNPQSDKSNILAHCKNDGRSDTYC